MILEKLCGQNWPAHLRTNSNHSSNSPDSIKSGSFQGRKVGECQVEENRIPKGVSDITFRSATRGLVHASKSLTAAANCCGKLPDRKVKMVAITSEFAIKLLMKLVVQPKVTAYLKAAVKA